MARTYGSMDNSHGREVTAMSAKYAHLRGWHAGVMVEFAPDGDMDTFDVFLTHGSNGNGHRTLLGTVRETENGPVWESRKKEAVEQFVMVDADGEYTDDGPFTDKAAALTFAQAQHLKVERIYYIEADTEIIADFTKED